MHKAGSTVDKNMNISALDNKQIKNVIWEGRYQPIHLGHLAYIRKLLQYSRRVWIIVLANELSHEVFKDPNDLLVKEFSQTVDPHHLPNKNFLPFWVRYLLVTETIKAEFEPTDPITVMSGRRLDLAWDLYGKILPPDRAFLTPLRDDFEDAKAKAWQSLNENNFRIDVDDLPKISATLVRERIEQGGSLDDLLHPVTIKLLTEFGYLKQ